MGWQVIRQPDGRLAVFSSVVDDWIARNLTAEEAEELFAEEMGADIARRLRKIRQNIQHVLDGNADKAYPITSMTWEQAEAAAKYDPECEDDITGEGEQS